MMKEQINERESVRLDKWLWAARFFKTRSLAKQAIEGGKIIVDGNRPKASREICAGAGISVRQGWDTKEIIVKAVSDKRGGAAQAALLYEETQASVEQRLANAAQRKAMNQASIQTKGKPTSKERRKINDLKRQILGQ